jgi:hypothetical protein
LLAGTIEYLLFEVCNIISFIFFSFILWIYRESVYDGKTSYNGIVNSEKH